VYYQEACRYWPKASNGAPFFKRNGKAMPPPHGRVLCLNSAESAAFTTCVLNSSLFYWFYSLFSDCEHINDALVRAFPLPAEWREVSWQVLERKLSTELAKHATRKLITTSQGHTVEYDEQDASRAKHVIDEIDTELGTLFGLTADQAECIANYDVKYRMGNARTVED
jgi:hypothetical protein